MRPRVLRNKFIKYIKDQYDYRMDLLIFCNDGSREMPDVMVFHNKKEDVIINSPDALRLTKMDVIKYCGCAFFIGDKETFGFAKTKSINLLRQNNWFVSAVQDFNGFKNEIDLYMKLKMQTKEETRKDKGHDYFLE